jgi:hypothetical protein
VVAISAKERGTRTHDITLALRVSPERHLMPVGQWPVPVVLSAAIKGLRHPQNDAGPLLLQKSGAVHFNSAASFFSNSSET